jgi:hypothetical protein
MIPQCIPKKKEGKECGIQRRLNRDERGVCQRQGCKVFRATVLKGGLGAVRRLENAKKKRCSNTPIYFGKGV